MLISVVIPIYNARKYINKCITSVLNQTFRNIEVILVDDGSTDGSGNICDKYNKNFSNIKVVHKKNGGLSDARNCGLKVSSGEYISFLDADDWWENNYAEKCVHELESYHPDLLFTSYVREFKNRSIVNNLFDYNKKIFKVKLQSKNSLLIKLFGPLGQELKNPAKIDDFSTAWGKFYKTSICKKMKFEDTKKIGTEDAWFNINFLIYTKKIEYLGGSFYHYNKQNDNSLVNTYNKNLFKQWCNLYKIMGNFIKLHSLPYRFNEALDNRIIVNLIGLSINIFNSDLPLKLKYVEENKLLNQHIYSFLFKKFPFEELTFKWRIFFKLAQKKKTALLVVMIILGIKFRKVLK